MGGACTNGHEKKRNLCPPLCSINSGQGNFRRFFSLFLFFLVHTLWGKSLCPTYLLLEKNVPESKERLGGTRLSPPPNIGSFYFFLFNLWGETFGCWRFRPRCPPTPLFFPSICLCCRQVQYYPPPFLFARQIRESTFIPNIRKPNNKIDYKSEIFQKWTYLVFPCVEYTGKK